MIIKINGKVVQDRERQLPVKHEAKKDLKRLKSILSRMAAALKNNRYFRNKSKVQLFVQMCEVAARFITYQQALNLVLFFRDHIYPLIPGLFKLGLGIDFDIALVDEGFISMVFSSLIAFIETKVKGRI